MISAVLETLREAMKEQYFRKMLNHKEGKNPKEMSYDELKEFAENNNLLFLFKTEEEKFKKMMKNMNYAMSYLISLEGDVSFILEKLYSNSKNSFLVGGSVRDTLLGKTPKDFDFVTDLSYDKLKEIFCSKEFSFKETGKQFLVFNLNFRGVDYEIANFRKDGTYTDGRRPDSVQIGTIEDDMNRRDFSINAMYWNFDGIIATKQSINDIQNKVLRFIGKPEDRIAEDALRVIRFYRILKSKELTPDEKSLRAVRTHFEKAMTVSPHRMMMEIERICL